MTLITFSQQQAIKPISSNNEQRFSSIMQDTETNELQDLLGMQLYNDMILYPTKTTNKRLLDGLSWVYGDAQLQMNGLKYVLAWYFYANYIHESDLQDTFSGVVVHNFDESRAADKSRKDKYASRARETAGKYWAEVKLYLDNNSDDYPLWLCDNKRKVFKPLIRRLSRPTMNTDFFTRKIETVQTLTPPDVTKIEVEGVVSLSAGLGQKITFDTNLGTTNYQLSFQAWDSTGVSVFPVLQMPLEDDGFTIDLLVDATLSYNARQL